MARLLRMPGVAANATEAVLQEWVVPEKGAFEAGDVVAVVETEKALVDVEAEADGVLVRALVGPNSQVDVGAPVALLADPGETVDDVDALLAGLGVVADTPAVEPERRIVPDDPEGGTASTGLGPRDAELPAPVEPEGAAGRIFASPLARRLAHENDLALEELAGTGPRGRILRRDVEAALRARSELAAPGPGQQPPDAQSPVRQAPTRQPSPAVPAAGQGVTELPHSRVRRAIASRLTQSKQEVPHFYVRGSARVDRLLRLREELNDGAPTRISVNDLVVKAVARAHTRVPALNVTWTPDAMRAFPSVDVAVAVATGSGLVTPVLRGVDSMTVGAVADATRDLVARAREGRLKQDELEGGTVAVTNLGMYGTAEFAAIINPPQSSILAVGAARREPVVTRKGNLKPATVLHVTLSVDHRAVDGAEAAEWMRELVRLLERPVQLLA